MIFFDTLLPVFSTVVILTFLIFFLLNMWWLSHFQLQYKHKCHPIVLKIPVLASVHPKKKQRTALLFLSFSFIVSRALCLPLGCYGNDGWETFCFGFVALSVQLWVLSRLVWVQNSAAWCRLHKSSFLIVQLKRSKWEADERCPRMTPPRPPPPSPQQTIQADLFSSQVGWQSWKSSGLRVSILKGAFT